MDPEPIDLQPELRKGVDARLSRPPVVPVGPVLTQTFQIVERDALRPVLDRLALRPAQGPGRRVAEVRGEGAAGDRDCAAAAVRPGDEDPELAVPRQRGDARVLGADEQRLACRSVVVEDQLLVNVEGRRALGKRWTWQPALVTARNAGSHSDERVITIRQLTRLRASAAI